MGLGHRLHVRDMCLGGLPLGVLVGLCPTWIHRGRGCGLNAWRRLNGWSKGCCLDGRNRRRGHRRRSSLGLTARHLDIYGLHLLLYFSGRIRSRQLGGATEWRIGLAVIGTADRDFELWLYTIHRVLGLGELRPEGCEVERVSLDRQARERLEEAANAGPALAIEVHRDVWPIFEDASHQAAQHRSGPHFDEAANTGFVHGLDHVDELHRAGELLGELRAQRVGLAVVRDAGGVRVDGSRTGAENSTSARYSPNAPLAFSTTGEWNAVATGSRRALICCSASFASIASISLVSPESTTCSGALWLAITTGVSQPSSRLRIRSIGCATGDHRPGVHRSLGHQLPALDARPRGNPLR